MTIDFISDLHLDKTRPEVNKYFINYLDNINKDVTDLYILGDLFEYWVGDDDPMDGLNEIRASISILGSKIVLRPKIFKVGCEIERYSLSLSHEIFVVLIDQSFIGGGH